MFRLSNCVFSILNILLMISGIATIISAVYLRLHGSGLAGCQMALHNPLLILGLFLFILSLIGLIGSFFRNTFLLWIYSFVTFVLVVGIFVFMIFSYIVTHKGAGKTLSGLGFKEYRLGDYTDWLENHFVNGKNWEGTRSCLIDAQACNSLGGDVNQEAEDFYKKKLSSVQSGCCKPPTHCGFEFKNATYWTMPISGPAVKDTDCITWSNVQTMLCYDCTSCKAGVLDNIRKDWEILAIINGCVLAYIIIIYSTSCCTRRNIRAHNKYSSSYKGFY